MPYGRPSNLGHGKGPFKPRAFFQAPNFSGVDGNFGDGNGYVNNPDLWSAASNTPRIQFLFSNDEIVAQPISIVDENYEAVLYTARPRVTLFDIYDTDELASHPLDYGEGVELYTAKPVRSLIIEATQDEIGTIATGSITVDESEWSEPFTVNGKVWMPVPWQFGAGEGSIWNPIAEDYYFSLDSSTKRSSLVVTPTIIDEVIVSQPVAIAFDEGVWEAVWPAKQNKWLFISDLQDEIGTAAQPLSIEDGYWIAPFSIPSGKWIYVFNAQDEIVAQPVPIHVDELYYWSESNLVKVRQVLILLDPLELTDTWVPPITPPPVPPPTPPPVIHGHGKFRTLPQFDVVDEAAFPQDNVGVSNC